MLYADERRPLGCRDEESNPGPPGSETSAPPLGHRPSLDTHGKEQCAKMVWSTAKAGDSKLQELKYQLELQKIQLMADLERKQWAQAKDEKRRNDAEAERIFRAEQAERDRQV